MPEFENLKNREIVKYRGAVKVGVLLRVQHTTYYLISSTESTYR